MSTLFFAYLLSLLLAMAATGQAKTAVVLSTDVGNEIDDQWAIVYLLTNPDFDVRGIISAHAPSLPDPSAHATYLVLKNVVEEHLGMAVHPPLFEGSSLPLRDRQTPQPGTGVEYLLAASREFSAQNRLVVLTIGAATDVASALLRDPAMADRITVVAMGFQNQLDGKEYNVENDPIAWQVILDSLVPVVIGTGEVCRADLSLGFNQARDLISTHGPIGAWLWEDYQSWYFRSVKTLRVNDFSKPWVIWDIITLAYLEQLTKYETKHRPHLSAQLRLEQKGASTDVTWITSVDSRQLWKSFTDHLDAYQETHRVSSTACQR